MCKEKNHTQLILASASPRRREILGRLGLTFSVMPSECEEIVSSTVPEEIVKGLSCQKAEEIKLRVLNRESSPDRTVVLGADTIVVSNGLILGKPADREDAFRMIQELQGKTHSVFTGVTILVLEDGRETDRHVFSCETKVVVNAMTEKEILDYLETGEADDKAGAYGIQGRFCAWIGRIEGDYNNVVGLPAAAVWEVLKAYL